MLLLLLLVVVMVTLVVCRRRRKSHHDAVTAAPHCTSSRSTTSVSTISAACNGGGGGGMLASSLSGLSHGVDEPPPPYSSLLTSPSQQPAVPATGLVRDRTAGRSLPPTPNRRVALPAAAAARDSVTEHIYDEPATLFQQSTTLSACPRSSMCRVRLGTTALRPATLLRPSQSPMSVSRQRACGGSGTHQPRRSAHSSAPSHSASRSQPPFFISNFTMLPMDASVTSQPLDAAAGTGVLYDEPWDMHSAAAAIPLTAVSHRHRSVLQPCDWSELDVLHGAVSDAAQSHRRRQAADLSDSSSSPLVTDAPSYSRHYSRHNHDMRDLLSPTCV